MQFPSIKKYFDSAFTPQPVGNYSQIKGTRASAITQAQANKAAKDPISAAILKAELEKVERLRGTNVKELIDAMSDALAKGGRKDNKGSFQNADLRDAASNLKIVTKLLEKNEQNEQLTNRQIIQLTAGLQQVANVQTALLNKDPRYSSEGRLIRLLLQQRDEDKSKLLNNRNLNTVFGGQNSVMNRGGGWSVSDNPFLKGSRNALYAITGPLGPLFMTLDDIVSELVGNRQAIMDGFRKVGRVFEGGFTLFSRFGIGFKNLLNRLFNRSSAGGGGGILSNILDLIPGGKFLRRMGGGLGSLLRGGGKAVGGLFRGGGRALGGLLGGAARWLPGIGALLAGGLGVSDLMDEKDKGSDPNQSGLSRAGSYANGALNWGLAGAGLGSIVPGIGTLAGGAIGAGAGLVATFVSRNWSEIKDWTKDIWDQAKTTFTAALSGFQAVMQMGLDGFKSLWDKGTNLVSSLVPTPVKEGVKSVINAVASAPANAAKLGASAGAAIRNFVGLGSISQRYESGNRGVGTISTGKGDAGGASYGKYQLASNNGSMAAFLSSPEGKPYASAFDGLKPGTIEFNNKYKEVSSSLGGALFDKAQSEYIKRTHYDPLVARLAASGIDVSKQSRGFQEAVFSTAVQYGAKSNIIQNAFKGKDFDSMTDAEKINAIQDYKAANVNNNFRSSSPAVRASIAQRIENERKDLLSVRGEQKLDIPPPQGIGAADSVGGGRGKVNPSTADTQGAVNSTAQTSVNDVPIFVDDSGLLLMNTTMLG